jgi:hypothetical protein
MVVPGPPTGVTLEVYDATSLKVLFHPPSSDGGDAVDSYLIQYSPDPDFPAGSTGNASVIMLSAGAPYYRVVTGLTSGVDYFVQVLGHNAQGFGPAQASLPTFDHPRVEPYPPATATIGITSDTMLTVFFTYPIDDGGDNVTHYMVEWDTSATFNSLSSHPDKGAAVVDAAEGQAHTIEYLTTHRVYYVRVSARNRAGWGQPRVATVLSDDRHQLYTKASPALRVPGQPVSLSAEPGTHSGYLSIRFDAPRVPAHGLPCFGFASNPGLCPTPVGGTQDAANGGTEITSYKVEWSIDPDFSGAESESDTIDVDGGVAAYTVRNLTVGRRWYVRVAARNIMGYSAFCSRAGNSCFSDRSVSALSMNTSPY